MLRQRLYYTFKPYVPWRVRMAFRRLAAGRVRAECKEVWPIDKSAGARPPQWMGWPEGRRFAVILTHDVEGPAGLTKCRRLAELEMEFGFRSSFNLIPEGSYVVPPDLRSWLAANGFEVGVHDLNHDGKLYQSRRGFAQKAARINQYLRAWGATGFRSGFMLRNLDWIHDLDVTYDASTFDTDPFEFQPDGTRTIFPFWIHAPPQPGHSLLPSARARGGYLELSYTLPQDSTLFLVLREQSPDIWIKKLDWIANHGGMAMVNVHPDYIRFAGERSSASTYPVSFYTELLQHIRTRYQGQYWHGCPGNIAHYMNSSSTSPSPKSSRPSVSLAADGNHATGPMERLAAVSPVKASIPTKHPDYRIVMLLENNYPSDTRVRNEATLLALNGYRVSVVCFRKPRQARFEIVGGVRVYRFPRIELFQKTESDNMGLAARILLKFKVLIGYGFEYAYFTGACFLISSYIFLRHGFDAIHAHNPPDTLFLVALPFRLLGKKYVFDHHDLCPELYQSRFRTGDCLQTRILGAAEWFSLKLANITIATNESYKEVQLGRGRTDPEKIFVVRNGPSEHRMAQVPPSARLRSKNRCILVYIGSLNPQDGVDYLIRSLDHLVRNLRREDFYCVIMGSGDSLDDLRAQTKKLHLEAYVELTGYVSEEELQANLAAADICVDPDPSSPLNSVSTWIKIMEYMAFAKPIVTYDLKETRYSAQAAAVYVPPNDEIAFAQAIADLMDSPDQRKKMGEFARSRVEDHLQWSVVGQNLLRAYEYLQGAPMRRGAKVSDTNNVNTANQSATPTI